MKIYDRRVISLFLAIIMSTLLIIGCSEPTDKISDTTTSDAVSTDTVAIDSDEAPDFRKIVPITDFNGWQYCMLSIQNSAMSAFFDYELTTEELTGEVVNDAVYTRNMTIEEAFNITLTENRVPDFLNVVQKCVQSGDNAYQLVIGGWGDMATLSTTGALLDWNSMDVIDVYKPWYNQSINSGCMINGRIYLELNYIPFTGALYTHCMFFNKSILADMGLESPYTYVLDGTWTIDRMISYLRDTKIDKNGDSKYDENDFYGLLTSHGGTLVFTYAFDNKTMEISDDYTCTLTLFSDRMVQSVDKVLDLCYNSNSTYIVSNSQESDIAKMFRNGQSIMYAGFLSDTLLYFRDMENDYGLLPYPKLNEEQSNYYTKVGGGSVVLGLPITNYGTIDFLASVTEALAIESYNLIYPAVYEISLQGKALRDNESLTMYRIIMDGAFLDFTQLYRMSYTAYCNMLQTCVEAQQNIISSRMAAISRAALKHYQGILDKFAELDAAGY